MKVQTQNLPTKIELYVSQSNIEQKLNEIAKFIATKLSVSECSYGYYSADGEFVVYFGRSRSKYIEYYTCSVLNDVADGLRKNGKGIMYLNAVRLF